jgi:hypothetical protein
MPNVTGMVKGHAVKLILKKPQSHTDGRKRSFWKTRELTQPQSAIKQATRIVGPDFCQS